MDERVLRNKVGSREVIRDQLQALIKAAQRPHITIQIVPEDSEAPGLLGAFAIADPRKEACTVYLESAREGQVSDRPDDVEAVIDTWDAIRTNALRGDESLDLIVKLMEQKWT